MTEIFDELIREKIRAQEEYFRKTISEMPENEVLVDGPEVELQATSVLCGMFQVLEAMRDGGIGNKEHLRIEIGESITRISREWRMRAAPLEEKRELQTAYQNAGMFISERNSRGLNNAAL